MTNKTSNYLWNVQLRLINWSKFVKIPNKLLYFDTKTLRFGSALN